MINHTLPVKSCGLEPLLKASLVKTHTVQVDLGSASGSRVTTYADLKAGALPLCNALVTAANLHKLYTDFYKADAHIRVLPLGTLPEATTAEPDMVHLALSVNAPLGRITICEARGL